MKEKIGELIKQIGEKSNMTKKDYIRIADVIKDSTDWIYSSNTRNNIQMDNTIEVEVLINNMCNMLEKDNPKFDRDIFKDYIMEMKQLEIR